MTGIDANLVHDETHLIYGQTREHADYEEKFNRFSEQDLMDLFQLRYESMYQIG